MTIDMCDRCGRVGPVRETYHLARICLDSESCLARVARRDNQQQRINTP